MGPLVLDWLTSKLERGLYATVPRGVAPGEFIPDRYLAALAARPDCIFSHHAALELLGTAHSDWNVCTRAMWRGLETETW